VLVVDLTRYLPGAYAGRELLRLGARVVRLEPPGGDPMRTTVAAWDAVLNAGKESVVCDLKRDVAFARALLERADVVLAGFRPGVAERLRVGPGDVPERCVYCAITGFGADDTRAGHDLNYLGWAGALAETAPALPPLPIADLAAGALAAVTQILAALLERERSGKGASIIVSMTHNAHELARFGDPLTGRLACYRIYECADGRHVTVAALEEKFFRRLCELIGRPELASRQYEADQDALKAELAAVFTGKPQREWLELFDGEDVAAGPVATYEEAARTFARADLGASSPKLGQHTARWRAELGL
jgi:crotonobetainyl-CoA:carnitine CoA-transferase CaiB-like acyl-CoA transferase